MKLMSRLGIKVAALLGESSLGRGRDGFSDCPHLPWATVDESDYLRLHQALCVRVSSFELSG